MNIIAYTDSVQSIIQFVMQDIGVSIISEVAAKEFAKQSSIKMYELDDFTEERYFYLVYNQNKTLSLISKLFIEEVTQLAIN